MISRTLATLASKARTCATCRHGERLTAAQFRKELSVESEHLARTLSLTDHPQIRAALDAGARFVRCYRDRSFHESADSCELHSLVGMRDVIRKVRGEPDPVVKPAQVATPTTRTPLEDGLCFACELPLDFCVDCKLPRGRCGTCECGAAILYSRETRTWRCAACARKGDGYHPSMPLKWPHGRCDACRERHDAAAKASGAPTFNAGTFGGGSF